MRVFIGYDSREDIAAHVCKHSLTKFDSSLEINFLKINDLRQRNLYYREHDPLSSTEFTFTRFLVPYLCGYKGWAMFVDCDFLFLEDIENLFKLCDDRYAVMVVQHDYKPTNRIKMDNKVQYVYPRKNWSSLILWNCAHPSNQLLTLNSVNQETGEYLHRFSWLNDSEIGTLSHEWNWLVGWYKEPIDGKPKALHYTEGGPWFDKYKNCEYSEMWNNALNDFSKSTQSKI